MISQHRKLARALFPSFKEKKILYSGEVLRVVCYQNTKDTKHHTRVAVVVSKKMYVSIVSRNLFKRRVFSVMALLVHSIDRQEYNQWVIFPTKEVSTISYEMIRNDLNICRGKIS